jgi:hypothetical protein
LPISQIARLNISRLLFKVFTASITKNLIM